ncbi:hypothetical protein LLH06_11450 [Mucilaginibacter daejeonensis]|uniref:hypothetical protein n=1 Tax=Mucilaginibacter daejeonensis TaxID=398049 RepID=UPI001D17C8E9|nr:hypothetical protein [Mucilaginibacter daejeonensis]UEG51587.1 hypothetical protein LLH06_11450 [Mucilaginibacter daejeonensis]
MKKHLLLFFSLFIFCSGFAQETVERTRKFTADVVEKYSVLKTNDTVMHGTYAAYIRKTLVAAGRYDNNKKVGTWTFFDAQGKLCQRFNYDRSALIYEAPIDSLSGIRYLVDDSLKNDPKFTRPVRIGGRFYGFLSYINLVRLPKAYAGLSNETDRVSMELLISPGGRLAEFKLRIGYANVPMSDGDEMLTLNTKLLTDEDKVFLPATLNDQPIGIRMIIPCYFYKYDEIRMR